MRAELDPVRAPVELYDLQTDPWERTNLAQVAEVQAVLSDLRQRLLAWMEQTQDPLLVGPVASPYYSDALARLRAEPAALS
jgi:arylsulfatase A-like enzyme